MAVADLLHANRMEHISDIGLQSATPEASARELRLSAIALNCDGLRTVVDRESCWRFELELQVRMAEDAPIDHALLGVIVIDGSIERIQEHVAVPRLCGSARRLAPGTRSEAHTSELQSLMRISYAVFCLNTNTTKNFMPQHYI